MRAHNIRDELRAIATLELGEVLRSRWLVFSTALYASLAALFVLVGLRESSLFGFTGMGRVLFSFCHALVVLLPLLALTATGQVVGRARDDGTLELLLSHPIRRATWFWGVAAVRYLVLAVPLAVWMIVMAVAGRVAFGDTVPLGFVARAVAVSASLLLAFTGIGLAISTTVRNPAKALMLLLVAWAAAVALLDVGLVTLMLQHRLAPRLVFLLAAANPVEGARLALLAGADASLSVLGPVGFYLAHRVGDGALVAIGLAWPALVGALTLGFAARRFARGDLV